MVKAARIIPDAVRATQARASDPAASAFVSANAGSGKTHVLVQRVIRLLLDDVAPEKILCITFTKAAAANMAERVFTTLGHWVTLDDDALDAAIRDAGIPHPSARLRKSARKLFEGVVGSLIRPLRRIVVPDLQLQRALLAGRIVAAEPDIDEFADG